MSQFFTLGPSEIDINNFRPVENSIYSIKPLGGLWATTYDQKIPNYNVWVEYLTRNLHVLFYKYCSDNTFTKPGVVLNLDDDANIFYLQNYQDFSFLQRNYPHENEFFDYKVMSEHYDGLFVDISSIFNDTRFTPDQIMKFETFGVSSLILFNSNPIRSYQKCIIEIDPFDYEFPEHFINYNIIVESEEKSIENVRILKRS